MTGFRRLVAGDPNESVPLFIAARWDIEVEPRDCGAGLPQLLCGLWYSYSEREVFGVQNRLLPKRDCYWIGDWLVFFEENQSVWHIAVDGSGDADPEVAVVEPGEPPRPLGTGLAEFILRAAVEEAVLSSPVWGEATLPLGDLVSATGTEARSHGPIELDKIGNMLPSIWSDDELVGIGFERGDEVTIFAGASDEPAAEWQHVAEVSLEPGGDLEILNWPDGLVTVVAIDPAHVRLRVSWGGVPTDHFEGMDADGHSDEHLYMQLWPSPDAPPTVIRWWPPWKDRLGR